MRGFWGNLAQVFDDLIFFFLLVLGIDNCLVVVNIFVIYKNVHNREETQNTHEYFCMLSHWYSD